MNTTRSKKKLEEFHNSPFKSTRQARVFKGTINAAPEVIYPLLCSVREADWLPNSNHKLVYSDSGYAEDGYIFQSDFFGFGMETWVRHEHKENESLAYVRCSEDLAIQFRIDLRPNGGAATEISIGLVFSSLTEEGNRMVSELPTTLPFDGVVSALEHYIKTGEQIKPE